MSVIMGIVVMLISSSRATYREVKTDAVLQTEADIARNFIGEIAVEAKTWGMKDYSDGSNTYPFIWFMAPDNDSTGVSSTYFYYVFLLKGDKLRYGKIKAADALNSDPATPTVFGPGYSFPASGDVYGNNILTDAYAVLAEHLAVDGTGISCNESTYLGPGGVSFRNDLINVKLNFSYNEHDYTTTMNYAGRNNNEEAP